MVSTGLLFVEALEFDRIMLRLKHCNTRLKSNNFVYQPNAGEHNLLDHYFPSGLIGYFRVI